MFKFKKMLCLAILFFGCADNDRVANVSPDSQPRVLLPVDASPQPDSAPVRIWDARPPAPDSRIDASPPPQVCPRLGLREACLIEGLEGPCADGERTCNITSWSQCNPVNFPRTEICDDLDNDCDGRLNESPSLGDDPALPQNQTLFRSCYTGPPGTQKAGLCRPGISVCEELSRQTDAGVENYYSYGPCQSQTTPAEEECDSLDNDCDSNVDEGVLNVCDQCGPDPVEECNGIDDDCDEQTDEGLLNDCGQCGETPRELCDFLDNDCDGNVDEDFEDEVCACDHPDYVPQPEVCNGADEDCDGFIDEGPDGGPLSKLCSTDLITQEVLVYDRREDGPQYVAGDCRLGASFCESRRDDQGDVEYGYFECQQEIRPGIERCNEEDDDCDGIADENFIQGSVAVMMVVDVSGSMDDGELNAAFNATRNSVNRLHANGIEDVCYMLAVVGNDDMPDPYLFYPGDNCVPGVEDPRIPPIEDMANAVNTLRLNMQAGILNQGGASENTLDAIGRFFTDDLIDWDNDGIPENILWNTNRQAARVQGNQDSWEVDLSQYSHRIVIVLGDEPAQGDEWGNHDAARAMAWASGMVFIIGTPASRFSYQPLIDNGAVHTNGLAGFGAQNAREIEDTVTEAIEEAACINAREEEEQEEEEQEEQALQSFEKYYEYASHMVTFYDHRNKLCILRKLL